MTTQTFNLRIDAGHPSLPGHFPGRPVVPAVLLLDRALAAAESWLGRPVRIASLQQAKFSRPLLPEQTADMTLTLTDGELRFEIRREDERIAQGVFKVGSGQLE